MKIIKPTYTPPKEEKKPIEENLIPADGKLVPIGQVAIPLDVVAVDDELIGNSERELLKEDDKYITFTITLTKKQYETFNKRGGVKWLKKKIACRPVKRRKND